MRLRLLAASLIAAGAACAGGRPADTPADTTTSPAVRGVLEQRTLLHEHSSGMSDSARRVITDQGTWSAAWSTVYARQGPPPALPAVDFTREMVVLVAMGTRSSGGYTIQVDSVRADSVLTIFVRSTSPGPQCGAIAALTEPVHAVAIRRSGLAPRFVEQRQIQSC